MTITAGDVVNALYLAVFGRKADPDGFNAHVALLEASSDRLAELAYMFHCSAEHSSVMGAPAKIVDHTQDGELQLILRTLVRSGQRHGIIVDVGARGRERSNSFDLLSQFGWRGLLIEANPALYEEIERDFSSTDHVLVGCAVGIDEGRMPFFVGNNDDVSSLLEDHAGSWGALRGRVEVEVRKLGGILAEHGIPHDFDVLSLDIEGLDVAVFRNLIETTPYRPGLVLIEASYGYVTKSLDDINVGAAVKHAYHIVGQTGPNLLLSRV